MKKQTAGRDNLGNFDYYNSCKCKTLAWSKEKFLV